MKLFPVGIGHFRFLSCFAYRLLLSPAVALGLGVIQTPASAQIFVTSSSNGTISEYTTSGALLNPALVSGLTEPTGIAVSGGNMFVINVTGPRPAPNGVIGEYTLSGATINSSLISSFNEPVGIAASGTGLFLTTTTFGDTEVGTVAEYTTSGNAVNSNLAGFPTTLSGIAISGSNIFVGEYAFPTANSGALISEYTTSGGLVNPSLISRLTNGQLAIAVSGTNCFVANSATGTVGEYTTSGATVNASLLSSLTDPIGIAVSGTVLFVLSANGTIGEYTTSGATINATLVSGLTTPGGLAVVGPVITAQPLPVTLAVGQTASFYVGAAGVGPFSYQWYLNGVPISGATDQYLEVTNVSSAIAGSYTCLVADGNGYSAQSAGATLTISTSTDLGRLVNLSVRTNCGTGFSNLVAGLIVGGAGNNGSSKSLLIRAVGPELANFGVPGVLQDPSLEVYNTTSSSPVMVAQNVGWSLTESNESAVAAAESQTGAFHLTPGSLSSALVVSLPPGAFTENIAGVSGDTGIALAEVYDMTSSFTPTTPRLINVSARANVTANAGNLIAGFVIGGSTNKTLLVRGTGPGLAAAPFNISGVLDAPMLSVYQTSGGVDTLFASNAGWGGDSVLASVAARVYAFSQNAMSADCALLITLPPGTYTANLSSGDGTSGIALIEVYELP